MAQYNVVFVTSTTQTANLGGLAGADAICQNRANAAGLTGTFRAWLSSSTVNALSRMGSARGFVRRDGAPLADTLESLTTSRALLNAINYDENNVAVDSTLAWTGTSVAGVFSGNGSCSDWTSTTGSATSGNPQAGPGMWTNYGTGSCATPQRLYCFQIDLNSPLTVAPPTGRLIFVYSTTFNITAGGIDAADAACASNALNAGLAGTFKALLATSTATAVSRLDNAVVNYQRPDGVVVGTKADLGGTTGLKSGIWQQADGTYPSTSNIGIWTGSSDPTQVGTATTTCSNWTSSSSGTAIIGTAGFVAGQWWNSGTAACNSTFPRLYCVQTDTPTMKRRRAVLTGE